MKRLNVLLIDDETELTETLAERLEMRNISVEAMTDPAKALVRLKEKKFDVAILDLVLEGVRGFDVLKEMKELRPDMAVILLSGRGSDKDFEESKREGAFDFLMKPVQIEDLIAKMNQAVHR